MLPNNNKDNTNSIEAPLSFDLDNLIQYWAKRIAKKHGLKVKYCLYKEADRNIVEKYTKSYVECVDGIVDKLQFHKDVNKSVKEKYKAENESTDLITDTFSYGTITRLATNKIIPNIKIDFFCHHEINDFDKNDILKLIKTGKKLKKDGVPSHHLFTFSPGEAVAERTGITHHQYLMNIKFVGNVYIVFNKKKLAFKKPKIYIAPISQVISDLLEFKIEAEKKNQSFPCAQLLNEFTRDDKDQAFNLRIDLLQTVECSTFERTISRNLLNQFEQARINYKKQFKLLYNSSNTNSNEFESLIYEPLVITKKNLPNNTESIGEDLSCLSPSAAYERIGITGGPGIGKTTLNKYLLQQWSNGEWSQHYDWIFYIAVNRLTELNFPKMENKKYTLVDVLVRECFQHPQNGFIKDIPDYILHYYFTNNILPTGNNHNCSFSQNILIMLDGLNEQSCIPDHLKHILHDLLDAFHLLVTSRPDHLGRYINTTSLNWKYVKGLSPESIDSYINNVGNKIFSSIMPFASESFLSFLNQPNHQDLKDACQNPLVLDSAMRAYFRRVENYDISDADTNKIVLDIYNEIIFSLGKHLLTKQKLEDTIPWLTCADIFRCYQNEIAYLEYASCISNKDASFYLSDKLNMEIKYAQITEIGLLTKTYLNDLDFISSFPLLKSYFSARYLISCLRDEIGNINHYPLFYVQHKWFEKDNITSFIKSKYLSDPNELVWSIISTILKECGDDQTLAYFEKCKKDTFTKKQGQEIVDKIIKLNCQYTLTRKQEGRVLVISNNKLTQKSVVQDVKLVNVLKQWTKYRGFHNQLTIVLDEDSPIVTITSTNVAAIDKLLNFLTQITKKSPNQPMQTLQTNQPLFFNWSNLYHGSNKTIVNQAAIEELNDNEENQNEQTIVCAMQ